MWLGVVIRFQGFPSQAAPGSPAPSTRDGCGFSRFEMPPGGNAQKSLIIRISLVSRLLLLVA